MAEPRASQPARISPDQLRTYLDLGSPPAVIDVRTSDEYADGHVPGALNVSFWRVLAGGIPGGIARTDPVVIYCGAGPRAQMAMLGLRLRGFSNLSELDGHWAEWQRRAFPVARGDQP
jgi:phage shock protein E